MFLMVTLDFSFSLEERNVENFQVIMILPTQNPAIFNNIFLEKYTFRLRFVLSPSLFFYRQYVFLMYFLITRLFFFLDYGISLGKA